MSGLRKRYIPESAIPRGYYARHVADFGHRPGVLSGAELAAGASCWRWYRQQRDHVALVLRQRGVVPALVFVSDRSRWCRVWVDLHTRERVEVVVVN